LILYGFQNHAARRVLRLVLWWSKGGVLKGESAPRVRFLREIVESAPPGMSPISASYYPCLARAANNTCTSLITIGPPNSLLTCRRVEASGRN
jgi:hypothetical protein